MSYRPGVSIAHLRRPHDNARDRSAELSASNAISKQGEVIVISLVSCDNGIGAAILIGAVVGLWPPYAMPACHRLKRCGACESTI
jgi:hypothetical protein